MNTNPFDVGYFSSPELRAFPFARVGENCHIARNCTIVGLQNIKLGDAVRIDANTVIIANSGPLTIGNHVHVGIGCVIGTRGGVTLGDFSSLSHGVHLLSATDDFTGQSMTNSTLPKEVLKVKAAPIHVGRYVPVGTGAIVLPGVEIGEGAAINAMSFVNCSLEGWFIYSGNPVRKLAPRSRDIIDKHAGIARERGM